MPRSITKKEEERRKSESMGFFTNKQQVRLILERIGEWLTRIRCRNRCSAFEITGALSLPLSLEVAVHSIIAMSPDSIGLETRAILMDRATISPSSTSIV
jgi:hypothetical protein